MTTTLEVEVDHAAGGTTNLDDEVIRAEIWRTVNAAGRFNVVCHNQGAAGAPGPLNATFDVQDEIQITINGTLIFEGWIDGPGVTLIGQDVGNTFRQLIALQGVDRVQDMMFHNDFDYFYPEWTGVRVQQLRDIINDVINVQLPATNPTNISYIWPGVQPNVGGFEFREGGSFLGAFQELHNRADYLFYVEDGGPPYRLRSFAPGTRPCGAIYSTTGAYPIVKYADLQERQGDKLYNWVKVYGKNPMFDAWTEYNSASWTATPAGQIADDATTRRVGVFSQVVWNNNPVNSVLQHRITLPVFNYVAGQWDLSKGEIGIWAYYDNLAAAPGAPGVGAAPANMRVECRVTDNVGNIANYFGESSRIYRGEWGYCTFPLGEQYDSSVFYAADKWSVPAGAGTFNWNDVRIIYFQLPRSNLAGNQPSHFYIDGIGLPIAPIAISTVGPGLLRRRPLVLNTPDIRTQHALGGYATAVRTHSDSTDVNYVKFVGAGHTAGGNVLQYGGQDFILNIPEHGITNDIYYAVTIHHVCEPRQDVTDGYGYDYITEVEAIPVDTVAYDSSRLGYYAWMPPYRAAYHGSTGSRMK